MWKAKYENGCLIMLKYALEPLYAPEPLCDCLHQVVTVRYTVCCCCLGANVRVWDEKTRKHAWYQFPEEINTFGHGYGNSSTSETVFTDPSNRARLAIITLD